MSRTQAQGPPNRVSLVSRALAADRLGVWTVVSIVGGAIAPLTVVAGGATTGWAVAQVVAIPLAYLVIALLLVLFSGGYTAMSRRFVSAGPLYTFPTKGLGRPAGVGSGFAALLAYFTMDVGLLGGFGAVASPLLADKLHVSVPWWAFALFALLLVGFLGVRHVEQVGRVLAVLLLAEVLLTVVFAVVMFAHPAGGHVSFTAINPRQIGVAGFGAALAIAVAGFVGFESTGNLSEESKNPKRTIPLATYLAVGIIGFVYGGGALAMVVAAGPGNIIAKSGTDGTDTMFNLVAPFVPAALVTLGKVLLLTSLFAASLAFHAILSRYAFTMSREGVLPTALSRTSARTHAPVVASVTVSALSLLVVGVYAVKHWDPLVKLFFWQTVIGGFGVLALMVITSAATAVFFTRRRNRADGIGIGRGIIAPTLSVFALGWVLIETLQQFHELLGVDPSSPLRWVFPALFAVAFVFGLIRTGYVHARKPNIYRAIGTGMPPATDNPLRPGVPATVAGGW